MGVEDSSLCMGDNLPEELVAKFGLAATIIGRGQTRPNQAANHHKKEFLRLFFEGEELGLRFLSKQLNPPRYTSYVVLKQAPGGGGLDSQPKKIIWLGPRHLADGLGPTKGKRGGNCWLRVFLKFFMQGKLLFG